MPFFRLSLSQKGEFSMKKIHGAGTAAAKGQKTAGSDVCKKHGSGARLLCALLAGAALTGCAGPSTRVIVRSET